MFSLSDVADLISKGNKGRGLMEAAIRMGYVEDPDAMRDYYSENRSTIEGWFKQADVDMDAVIDDLL